jgi:hypothetical protein
MAIGHISHVQTCEQKEKPIEPGPRKYSEKGEDDWESEASAPRFELGGDPDLFGGTLEDRIYRERG